MTDIPDPAQTPGGGPGSANPTTDPINGSASASASTSSQLALGNDQWIQLRVKLKDLIRVGTDPSRTLANINSFEVIATATVPSTNLSLTLSIDALYLVGGFGPDVGDVGDPYVYRERYRSSITGEISNVGPPSRGGVSPRRNRVDVVAGATSGDPQCDLIDRFRLGGTLDRWTYIGTGPNTAAAYHDDFADDAISGGVSPGFDDFQPWPTLDLRRTGTCNVAGPALKWVSGDQFNLGWAPGSIVVVNGRACTIERVLSATILHLNENAGTGSAVAFEIPGADVLSQPLPALWGPDQDNVFFACGDPNNPGTLYWSKPGSPDLTSDTNSLIVTSGSEILQHGFIWDGRAYVASTEQVYLITPVGPGQYRADVTACGKGFWSRWAFCVTPEGTVFLEAEGISATAGGSVAQSLTDADLRGLFPHDGLPGAAANGIGAPDYSQTTRLRFACVNRRVYFDYPDLNGHDRTLVFSLADQGWVFDTYASGVWTRLAEPGAGVDDQVVGAAEGRISLASGGDDNGVGIPFGWDSTWEDFGDPRPMKLVGDLAIGVIPNGAPFTVTPVYDDGEASLPPQTVTLASGRRQSVVLDLNSGDGILARNVGVQIRGTTIPGAAEEVPIFSYWEPTAVPKVDSTGQRGTDWDDLGSVGAKFIQGVLIRANTFGATKSVQVQGDGGVVELTLEINHNGEQTKAYPLVSTGWTPFLAHLVRLVGADATPWQLYTSGTVWVFEPSPEMATEWTTQPTTHDLPGYLSVRDMVVAYLSTSPVTFTLSYDGTARSYTLPDTLGVYSRVYLTLGAGKGRSVQYRWSADEPFALFKRDMSVRVQGWGIPGGYQSTSPFGGPSRSDGAVI